MTGIGQTSEDAAWEIFKNEIFNIPELQYDGKRRIINFLINCFQIGARSVMISLARGLWGERAVSCVFLTGCDSGIGLSVAKHLASEGCVVYAGVRDLAGEGARQLSRHRVCLLEIDVKDPGKVQECVHRIQTDLQQRNQELSAVINNAGVMVFGEFEWQTEEQILEQFQVNVLGYMRVARAFLPLLRKYNGRLINMSSHCATVPLPCLSVYSATKAAVESWSSALALEMHKFDVKVITIHPGSYVRESCILLKQSQHAEEMWSSMSPELRTSSEPYFRPVMSYMSAVPSPSPISDPALRSVVRSAVFSRSPRQTYVNSPWRYALYYRLISFLAPLPALRRSIILSFISLPKYK